MNRAALVDSKRLLADYPFLAKGAGWKEFVTEFDRPECITARRKAVKAYRKEMKEPARELERLCNCILNLERRSVFSIMKADGSRGLLSRAEVARDRMAAAVSLAEKVRLLMAPSDEGGKLRRALDSEAKRKATPPLPHDKGDDSARVCYAFLGFVHRENRLPTKKELNVEVNRLTKSKEGDVGEMEFGDSFMSGSEQCRVYDCVNKIRLLGNFNWESWQQFRIVPLDQWDKPRWETISGLTDLSTPLGFKGLPEAHQDKGKKVRK